MKPIPKQKQALISNMFKRKAPEDDDICPSPSCPTPTPIPNIDTNDIEEDDENDNSQEDEPIVSPNIPSASNQSTRNIIDLNALPSDPADRPPIVSYHPNQMDEIRRAYLVKKAFQPRGHQFKWTSYSSGRRRFNVKWFDKYDWLEYSTKEEKAYCLYCYLFNESVGNQGGRDTFASGGFCNWSKPGALKDHVGSHNSVHNEALLKCDNLLNQM